MKKTIITILILIPIVILFFCKYFNNDDNSKYLTPLEIINLNVPEPSGLHFDTKTNTLWTVSDENSTIYNIDLKGNVIKSMKINGFDLEGITFYNDSTLAVILERDRAILLLDNLGNELNRFSLDLKGEPNKGLEGIVFDNKSESFLVINEKNPGVLFKVNFKSEIIESKELQFAKDYSGLFFDEKNNQLWITSDEDNSIYKCRINGELIKQYKVNIEQVEGIAIDFENSRLYVISDPLEKLYIFELP